MFLLYVELFYYSMLLQDVSLMLRSAAATICHRRRPMAASRSLEPILLKSPRERLVSFTCQETDCL